MKFKNLPKAMALLLIVWGGGAYLQGLQQNKDYVANVSQFSQTVSAFENEDYVTAIKLAAGIEKDDPTSYELPYMQARAYYFIDQHSLADDYFKKSFDIHAYYVENPEALIFYGLNSMQLNRPDDVLTIYEQLSTLHIPARQFADFMKIKNYLASEGLIQ